MERKIHGAALRRALGYLRPYGGISAGAFISLLAVSLTNLASPWFLQRAIDLGIQPGNLRMVWLSAIGLVVLAAIRGAFNFLQSYWSEAASQGVAYDLRDALYAKLQRLSFSYHDQAQTGQLMTRVTSDVETVRQFVGVGVLQFLSALVMLAGSAIILLWVNWQLALAALAVIPFIFLVLANFIRQVFPRFGQAQQKLGALNTVLQEDLAGVRVVKAFAAEPREKARYERANGELLAVSLGLMRVFAANFPLVFFFANLGTLIVYWFGGREVIQGDMTVGTLVAFNTYLTLLLMPIFILGGLAATLSRASVSAERVFEVLDAPVDVADRPGALELGAIVGRVEFQDVAFRYPGAGEALLKGISFVAEPGQTVAILGRTGSGKSTVINLIPRFYDVTAGRVLVDGHDVREVTQDSLRRQIGSVRQDAALFSGSIRDNIAYGRPDASQADIEAAARDAQAHDFIAALPEGYDTVIGERGVGLSGGQKQRLAIARALLVDPRILLFDDATSAVDAETEAQIQAALVSLRAQRTAFVIAQRVSTVRSADLILLLEAGRVVAQGTHEELLAASELYYEILASQLVDDAPVEAGLAEAA
jgi:ATP-binding cassette subfamily B protein